MATVRKKGTPSKAVKKAAEEQAKAEKTYNARVRFERLIARCDAINAHQYTPLVTDPETVDDEGEGEFEPDELARVPNQQIQHSLLYLDETQEILGELIGQAREALDAREE